jgi:hypothetical protein
VRWRWQGYLTGERGLAQISYSCTSPLMSDRAKYPTVRVSMQNMQHAAYKGTTIKHTPLMSLGRVNLPDAVSSSYGLPSSFPTVSMQGRCLWNPKGHSPVGLLAPLPRRMHTMGRELAVFALWCAVPADGVARSELQIGRRCVVPEVLVVGGRVGHRARRASAIRVLLVGTVGDAQ